MSNKGSTCQYEFCGDVLKVTTSRGDMILADADDAIKVMRYSWCVSKTGYAVANIKGKVTKMHRYILGEAVCANKLVDHKNGNSLDNRRSNLRICTHAENMRNVATKKTSKVGHLGIRMTKEGKFNVRIVYAGVEHHIGNFDTLEIAIKAREEAEDFYHGDFASHKYRQEVVSIE